MALPTKEGGNIGENLEMNLQNLVANWLDKREETKMSVRMLA